MTKNNINIVYNTLRHRGKFSEYLINKTGKFMPNNTGIVYQVSNCRNKFNKYLTNKTRKLEANNTERELD